MTAETHAEMQIMVEQKVTELLSREGSWNRLILEGDQGFIVIWGEEGETEVRIFAAAGRSLSRTLSKEEAQTLYEHGYRRKTAALCFSKLVDLDDKTEIKTLTQELCQLLQQLYLSSENTLKIEERFGNKIELNNQHLISAMKRLSKERSMSARQKAYWAIIRADVLLALKSDMPASLKTASGHQQWVQSGLEKISHISSSVTPKDFKYITNYPSAAIFTDHDALGLIDPRGAYAVKLPGRLAILLALEQGWSSLLINPRSDVGGELYRNELQSIQEGLKQLGW